MEMEPRRDKPAPRVDRVETQLMCARTALIRIRGHRPPSELQQEQRAHKPAIVKQAGPAHHSHSPSTHRVSSIKNTKTFSNSMAKIWNLMMTTSRRAHPSPAAKPSWTTTRSMKCPLRRFKRTRQARGSNAATSPRNANKRKATFA